MTKPVYVITYLWDDPKAKHRNTYQFTPRHANVLFKRLDEGRKALGNAGYDVRFIILTDHPTASDFDLSLMRYVPLWQDYRDLGRCFTRLRLFGEDVRRNYLGIEDDAIVVTLDLDIVIVKPEEFLRNIIDAAEESEFVGYRDSKNPACYSGALWAINPILGSVDHVYSTFNHLYGVSRVTGATEAFFKGWNQSTLAQEEDGRVVNVGFVGSDQCWITTCLASKEYPRLDHNNSGIWDFWSVEDLPGGSLPLNTTAVFCNGLRRDSSMPEFQERYPWMIKHWRDVA